MRRGFVVLLTLLMLVQFTWAATAACCLDELNLSAAEAQLHLQEAADPDQAHATESSGELKHVCDVGHCHCHHACVAVGDAVHLGLGVVIRALPYGQLPDLDKSHIPDGLDRPNWLRA